MDTMSLALQLYINITAVYGSGCYKKGHRGIKNNNKNNNNKKQ